MPPPILKCTNVQFGSKARASQTVGGLNAVIGTNCIADPVVANRVNATQTSGDSFSGMLFSYVNGILMYASESATVSGAEVFTLANQKMNLLGNGCITMGPWSGLTDNKFLIRYVADTHCGYIQKALGHSALSLDYEGGCMVTHAATYTGTPGYASTTQFYAFAGAQGTVIGCNSYVGQQVTDYTVGQSQAAWEAEVADGFIRFELGPVWPNSEKMRINPTETIWGNSKVTDLADCTQSGPTVTCPGAAFTTAHADGFHYICWADYTNGGTKAYTDQILERLSATTVRVGVSRTIATAQAARLAKQRTRINSAGEIHTDGALFVNGNTDQVYAVTIGSFAAGAANGGEIRFIGAGGAIIGRLTTTYPSVAQTFFKHESTNVWSALGQAMTFYGDVAFQKTITAAGTTGAQTINKTSGQVNVAAGQTTLVVTNSLVTANSIVLVQVLGTDATALTARVTKAAGSFTITLNAAATAETAVSFIVFN